MTYWEAFTQAKDKQNPDSNEDRIVIVPDRLYAVIDGATDKSGRTFDGLTGGQIAGRVIEDVLKKLAPDFDGPKVISVSQILGRINKRLGQRYRTLGICEAIAREPWRRFSAQVSIAIRQSSQYRFLVIGDAGVRINGVETFSGPKVGDIICAQLRAAVHRHLTERGANHQATDQWARAYTVEGLCSVLPGGPREIDANDLGTLARQARRASTKRLGNIAAVEIEEVLMAGLKGLHHYRNRPGPLGFATIDGTRLRQDMIIHFERPAAGIECLELFSDGYPRLPRQSTVAHWEAEFSKAERDDPKRVNTYADTKGSSAEKFADDRTILIVRPRTETAP
ncbi:MAG: hypothetical protein ACTSY1_08615 [Alphaproteobacteria bacterium]